MSAVRPVPLYVLFVGTGVLALPLLSQISPSPLPVYVEARGCALAMARADRVIDEIGGGHRTGPAERELEIARNMLDQQDESGCKAHVDNAIRAMK